MKQGCTHYKLIMSTSSISFYLDFLMHSCCIAPPYVESKCVEPFRSSSNPQDNVHDGQGCSIELVDDFSALDGEVGKRLNDRVGCSCKHLFPADPILYIQLSIMTVLSECQTAK